MVNEKNYRDLVNFLGSDSLKNALEVRPESLDQLIEDFSSQNEKKEECEYGRKS